MHLVDATMFYCPRSGGVRRYLLSKRRWLEQHAPSVRHTLLVPGPQRGGDEAVFCDGPSINLTDGYRCPLDLRSWAHAIESLRPELVEAADPYVPAWAVRRAAARLGIPAIAFFHSDMARMLAMRCGSWISPLAHLYLRRLYGGFDLVLAPSRVMLEQLQQIGVEHATLQPLGVDVATFRPTLRDAKVREELELAPDARLLIYAGRFAKEKNLPLLCETVERLGAPYHLLLVGGRRRERPHRHVSLLPFQRSSERLARLLASCDVFVHAGTHETYGLVAAEAMACGLPVAGVAQGAIPEIVDDTVGALARTAQASQLADAIDSIYARDLEALRRAARARAEMSYSWDSAFGSMLTRYAQLTSTATLPSPQLASVNSISP